MRTDLGGDGRGQATGGRAAGDGTVVGGGKDGAWDTNKTLVNKYHVMTATLNNSSSNIHRTILVHVTGSLMNRYIIVGHLNFFAIIYGTPHVLGLITFQTHVNRYNQN